MTPHTPSLIPALLLPLFAWRVYRRFHRNVGKQPLRQGRLILGIVVFAMFSLVLVAVTITVPRLVEGVAGGLVAGVALALVGLKLTRFETDSAGKHFYTPNTYIGIGLTLLLAARVVYRIGVLYYAHEDATSNAPAFMQSPLTLAILGLTAGYYIAFNAGVLIKGGANAPRT